MNHKKQAVFKSGKNVVASLLTAGVVLAGTAYAADHYISVNDGAVAADSRGNYKNDGATGRNSTAIGVDASAKNQGATAIGAATSATNNAAISIGTYSNASGVSSTAIGQGTLASANAATAIGRQANASGNGSTAIGSASKASGSAATAFGSGTSASGTNSTALGQGAQSSGVYSSAVGTKANASGLGSSAFGSGSVASGKYASAYGTGSNASGDASVAVGLQSKASGKGAVAIGRNAVASDEYSVALGANSTTSAAVGTTNATVGGVNYGGFAGTAPVATVSVGKKDFERTITNVAAGRITSDSTDAINGSQLYSVATQVSNNTNAINQLNNRHANLDKRLDDVEDDLRAGIAGATAIGFLQRPNEAGKSIVSAAVGGFRDQQAVAVGYAHNSDNNKWSIKTGVSVNTKKDVNWGGSVGYQW